MQLVLYNSFENDKKILAKKNFLIKNEEEFVKIDSNVFSIEELLIVDKKDYIEFNLFYKATNDKEKIEEFKNIYEKLIDKANENKHKDYVCKNCIDFYLDENDLNFSVQITNVADKNIISTDNYLIIIIQAIPEEVNIIVDGMISKHFHKIDELFKRKVFTDREKKFIINNFQQQQLKQIKEEITEEKNDKDTLNFKDFMRKDPTNVSKFKVTEEESKLFNANSLKIIDGAIDPNEEINKLIGLSNVKTEILKLNAKLDYRVKRESRNIYDLGLENLHMCFYGNPGTGKTTVARIMTGLLYNMGYVKKNKCIEINANEMKGTAIGQTAVKTKIILRNAKNKVLFIDEAYALADGHDGFGQEAIDTIVKEMEDNKHNLVIIFAGYKKEMQKFIDTNEGLKSRINRYIKFENYDTIELSKIFINLLHSKGLKITTDAMIKTMEIFKLISIQKNFSNGRFVRNYFEEIEEEHAFNTKGITDQERLDTIELEDIDENLIKQFIAQNKK